LQRTPLRAFAAGAAETWYAGQVMFLVMCQRGTHRWLSGIFLARTDAVSYVDEVPEDLRPIQRVVEASPNEYPVYLIEDVNGLVAHSSTSLEKLLASLERVSGDDWCYFNVYRFTEDWRPPRPGTDYMGAIAHVHVANRHLDRVDAAGIDSLWQG